MAETHRADLITTMDGTKRDNSMRGVISGLSPLMRFVRNATLAGLAVAIPAAIAAHYFEGKIVKNLSLVDVELRRLVPLLECYEGRTRFDISSNGLTERVVVSDRVGTGHVSDHSTPIKPPKLRT